MYTQLLHTPLTVAALPKRANLPGRQDMSKKFAPCIAPQMSAVRSNAATLKNAPSILTKKVSGIAATSASAKSRAVPFTSFLSIPFLCRGVTSAMLTIEKTGSIIETRVDSETSLPNASE